MLVKFVLVLFIILLALMHFLRSLFYSNLPCILSFKLCWKVVILMACFLLQARNIILPLCELPRTASARGVYELDQQDSIHWFLLKQENYSMSWVNVICHPLYLQATAWEHNLKRHLEEAHGDGSYMVECPTCGKRITG